MITLCFLLANDLYGANRTSRTSKQLFTGEKKVVDYLAARWAMMKKALPHSDLIPRYLIQGRRNKPQRSLLRAFAGGDTCGTPTETAVTALPYVDPSGTLIGKTDNYHLPPDTAAPTATGCPACVATGGVTTGSGPRGAIFYGTGIGNDAAYSITFNQANANLTATLTPTNATDDLALIAYTSTCSDSLADAIVVDDTGGAGVAESVTITNMPAGTYHIVADVYSNYYYYYYYGTVEPGGPYTLNVTCVAGQTCIQPVAPLAAGVAVTGRVLTETGQGVINATVILTDQHGVPRKIKTGPRGVFTFDDVEVGQTYIISVRATRRHFAPQVIQILDNLTNVEFVPEN